MAELMAITHDGKKIYFQKERIPFRNITEWEKKLIQEALSHMVYEYFPRIYSYSFDRVVGETRLVEVAEEEKANVFWVYRKNNTKWKVPVILTRNARKTTFITVTFERCDDKIMMGNWYFGGKSFPFPGQVERRRGSRKFVENCQKFWQNHALAVPTEEIDIPRSLKEMNSEEAERFLKLIRIRTWTSCPRHCLGPFLFLNDKRIEKRRNNTKWYLSNII